MLGKYALAIVLVISSAGLLEACSDCDTEWTLERDYEVSTDCGGQYAGRIHVSIKQGNGTMTSSVTADPTGLVIVATAEECSDSPVTLTIANSQDSSATPYACTLPVGGGSSECRRATDNSVSCSAQFTTVP